MFSSLLRKADGRGICVGNVRGSFPFYLPGTNQYLFIVENLSRNTALKSMAISEDIEVPMHKYETMKILLLSVDEVVIM